ncbi:MAG TPA: hypothetical protein VNK04_01775, partial [Gemmataceae bacterium]|nr:hypothetical protein [Gemmataceae bacterium]
QMSQVTAQTFLNDLTVGRIEAAYARTTEGFQARQTLDEFRALLAKNRAFQKQATVMVHPITMTPGTASFTATISAPDGAATCTVDVIKEGEQWKVDRFIITSGQAK